MGKETLSVKQANSIINSMNDIARDCCVETERANDEFVDENVSNEEIQILATYMKCEWLNRTILTWENVKPLYVERDFSQANLIDKLKQLLEREEYKALKLERIYYRSRKGRPFAYGELAEN